MTPEWINIIAPFASGAFGVGLAYGTLKGSIDTLKANVESLKERVVKTEEKLDNQVGETRCDKMRRACQEDIRRDLDRKYGEV